MNTIHWQFNQWNSEKAGRKRRRIFLLFIVMSFVFFNLFFIVRPVYSNNRNYTGQLHFSLLSKRTADFSVDPDHLKFRPVSMAILHEILQDKYPDAVDIDARISAILKEFPDALPPEIGVDENPAVEEPTPPEDPPQNGSQVPNDPGSAIIVAICGNTILNIGEQCDDGNTVSGDGCSATCKNEVCGNSVVDFGEQCDDGNTASGDGCSATCKNEFCGNSVVEISEQCDDGNTTGGDGCSATCKLEACGNNVVDVGEQCDDGDNTSGDGCSATCDLESCGNGAIDFGEQCDDGNTTPGDGCSASCGIEVCGNNVVDIDEQCDDGNSTDGDGCSATCTLEICGNSIVDFGEECDDGNTIDGDGCTAICSLEVCGNNVIDVGEECDDGNSSDGDGCSAACILEGPAVCTQVAFVSSAFDGKWIKLEIENTTDKDIIIEEIDIDWPAEMDELNKIDLDSLQIWRGSETTPPTIINSGWWGTIGDRTVETGNTEMLGFKFKRDSESGYAITVTFTETTADCFIQDSQ